MKGGGDPVAETILREHQQMAHDRAVHEPYWREIGAYCFPGSSDFNNRKTTTPPGLDRAHDSSPIIALQRFAAVLEYIMTPHHTKWHNLVPSNRSSSLEARVLEAVRDDLFKLRYKPRSGFARAVREVYWSIGAFGPGCLFVDLDPRVGIRYRAIHLSEIFIKEDLAGFISTVHRLYWLTADQALEAFGRDNPRLPEKIIKAADQGSDEKFEFIHCVKPRENIDPERADFRGMPIASYQIALDGKVILQEGGYRTMPYLVPRYMSTPNNSWGLSAARYALADMRMLNRMERSQIAAVNRQAEPVFLTVDEDLPQPLLQPLSINHGYVDPVTGRPKLVPLQDNGRIDLGEAKAEQKRQSIEGAFLGDFFRTLLENPQMTATHVLELANQHAAQMVPFVGRIQEEMLGFLIERELDLMDMMGLLPQELRGRGFEIEYESPITQNLEAAEAAGIMRTFEALGVIGQTDPNAHLAIDGSAALRRVAEVNRVPAAVIRSADEVQAMVEAQEQQVQAQAMLDAAPQAASAAETLARLGGAAP